MTVEGQTRPLILAVDDNAYTLRLVQQALRKANYEPLTAVSGEQALEAIARRGIPDLAIVDIHMPGGMSGFEFSRTLHQFSDLPVILLTAAGDEETILEGLQKHAEDYIVKPFNAGELTARVGGILDRMGRVPFAATPLLDVDDHLQIDFPNRQALVNGEPVALTPTEARLLYILMRQSGEVVSTEYILRRLWPDETAYEDRLHVHLHRLRKKLGTEASRADHDYVSSERGKGYFFLPNPYAPLPS